MKLSKRFTFEASHQLPRHPGKCARLHGHSWVLTVELKGPPDPDTGMVLDYYKIKEAVQPVVDRLDHQHLGHAQIRYWDTHVEGMFWLTATVEGMNWSGTAGPTSENLCLWIASQLPASFNWSSITLNETCTTACTLSRAEFEAGRKEVLQVPDDPNEENPQAQDGEAPEEGSVQSPTENEEDVAAPADLDDSEDEDGSEQPA